MLEDEKRRTYDCTRVGYLSSTIPQVVIDLLGTVANANLGDVNYKNTLRLL